MKVVEVAVVMVLDHGREDREYPYKWDGRGVVLEPQKA